MAKSKQGTKADCPHCMQIKQSLQTRYEELGALQKRYVQLEVQHVKLTSQLNVERNKNELQLARLYSSTSWRLMAPLRAVIRTAKNMRSVWLRNIAIRFKATPRG